MLDTNVVIRHGLEKLVGRSLLSAAVLQEMTAGAADDAELRDLDTLAGELERTNRLVVPNRDDWFQAGKVLNFLLRGVPSRRDTRPQTIDKGEQQRLVRDVLIARSAKRMNAAVVTYNRGDFEKIQRFCSVRLLPPEDFL